MYAGVPSTILFFLDFQEPNFVTPLSESKEELGMTARPNIFAIATSELSQDGFFTWLLRWADSGNAIYNKELNALAKRFVRLLITQKVEDNFQIQKVIAERQQEGMDIVAQVNGEHVLIIEDKINSQEHSDQLDRYK